MERCRRKGLSVSHDYRLDQGSEERPGHVRAVGLTETGILTSVSDYHIFLKMGLDRRKGHGQIRGHGASYNRKGDCSQMPFRGRNQGGHLRILRPVGAEDHGNREESGVDIKIRLCDTMGFGVTYPGAASSSKRA